MNGFLRKLGIDYLSLLLLLLLLLWMLALMPMCLGICEFDFNSGKFYDASCSSADYYWYCYGYCYSYGLRLVLEERSLPISERSLTRKDIFLSESYYSRDIEGYCYCYWYCIDSLGIIVDSFIFIN